MKLFSNRNRPVHLGPYPLERLPRLADPIPADDASATPDPIIPPRSDFARIVREYLDLFLAGDEITVSPERVSPSDAKTLTQEITSACYFLGAAQVGICEVRGHASTAVAVGAFDTTAPRFAVVVLVEHGRLPEPHNLARAWIDGAEGECSALRAVEIAVLVAGYIRQLGHTARVHGQSPRDIDMDELATCAGLVERRGDELVAPCVGKRFATAAVLTSLPVVPDRPLAAGGASASGVSRLVRWLGLGGTRSALERWTQRRRPSHLGSHPMEKLHRRDHPTTLIFDDEVPPVPQRAAFFNRAERGDPGEKARRERMRFATKHPLAFAMTPLLRGLVPIQAGPLGDGNATRPSDPTANARAVKSLAYFLGADMAGICEAKPYAWYSHDRPPRRSGPQRRPQSCQEMVERPHANPGGSRAAGFRRARSGPEPQSTQQRLGEPTDRLLPCPSHATRGGARPMADRPGRGIGSPEGDREAGRGARAEEGGVARDERDAALSPRRDRSRRTGCA